MRKFILAGSYSVYRNYLRENNLKEKDYVYLLSIDQFRGKSFDCNEAHIIRLHGWDKRFDLFIKVIEEIKIVKVSNGY